MKKEMRSLTGLLLIIFIVGNVSAVWWNPFSWKNAEISGKVISENNLIGYYDFEKGVIDTSSKKNNLENYRVYFRETTSEIDARFNGINSYLYSSSSDFEMGKNDFEISFMAKNILLEQNDVIIGKGNENHISEGYRILGNSNIGYYLRISDGTNAIRSEGIKINDKEWHEFKYVFERNKNNGIRAYLDGVQVGVSHSTTSITGNIDAKKSRFVIGRNSESANGYITGLLNNVKIYQSGSGGSTTGSGGSNPSIGNSCKYYWNCKIDENCNAGTCGPIKTCTASGTNICPSGQICDKETLKCKPTECSGISAECISSPFEVCVEGFCVEKECSTDDNCPTNTKCSEGICFKPMCNEDFSKCGSRNLGICYNGLCFSSQCLSNKDCPQGKVCNKELCFAKDCDSNLECKNTEYCINNICEKRECLTSTDCQTKGANFYCYEGNCVLPQCNSDSECPSNRKCLQRQCIFREICDDGIDNNKNGLLDYADPECASTCSSPKKITTTKPGKGAGAPTLIFENKSRAACCLETQCYGAGMCMSNGAIITVHQALGTETSYCRVNGTSAVFCKQDSNTYRNDGNGNCILVSSQPSPNQPSPTPPTKYECTVDSDCPIIYCFKAPCPTNKCISNKCTMFTPEPPPIIYCDFFKKCPSNMRCSSLYRGVCI